MIVKDKTKSYFSSGGFEACETCCVCDRDIPDKALCLRRVENKSVICLLCVVDIAEVKD